MGFKMKNSNFKTTNMNKTMKTIPTLDEVKKNPYDNVYEIIEQLLSLIEEHPEKPVKPKLPTNHKSVDLVVYTKELVTFEREEVLYLEERRKVDEHNSKIEALVCDYIKHDAGLDSVPEASRSKVWYRAYSDGHSDGYHAVYQKLVELVELF